ncbi:FAD-dependent oxidoreductase [Nesterenkonia lacusekhoensis]|uniref:Assimilatory nitrate reductase electron transfer subunit n=1 Tax=Nesterenkonia lacusekhoensis TaxID=150832 RepID=A0ABS4SY37_9MICC|nr:assimilatory nitrate reductase electron transfer subunit [Nesterenkonia lacusekhoensis]
MSQSVSLREGQAAQAHGGTPHVVIIGFGPVASRLAEELLPEVRSGALRLTIIGREDRAAYQRIRIGDVSVGRVEPEDLVMNDIASLQAKGAEILLGVEVTALDAAAHTLVLTDRVLSYTKLVLATGAEPILPRMSVELRRGGRIDSELRPTGYPEGVIALRDMEDALRIRRALERREPVVVLGGGVLGVEAALAVAEVGLPVTLLHRGNVPMGRQIDAEAGMLLRRELMRAGVDVRSACDVTTVISEDGELTAVRTSLGEKLPASLLVTCTGVRPRDELASAAGLPVKWGIVTGGDARSTGTREGHADVFAVGDCAAVDGRDPSGLIAPGWLQAEAAAASLRQDLGLVPPPERDASGALVEFGTGTGTAVDAAASADACGGAAESAESAEAQSCGLDVVLMKSKTLNVACAGDTSQDPWSIDPWDSTAPTVSTWSDPKHGQYLRIVTEPASSGDASAGERLVGFVSVGMPRSAAELAMHASRGTLPAADRTALLAAEHATQEAELGPEDVLCRCAGTTAGMVQEAAETCCRTVEQVSAETRAGTGCGTCHKSIEKILATTGVTAAS